MSVDQQTRRRIVRTGLTALDEELACPGYTLYAPLFGSGEVLLIDLRGNEVHRWDMPYPPGLWGYLLPNGNLFYGGKLKDDTWDRFGLWRRFKGGVMLEADWNGQICGSTVTLTTTTTPGARPPAVRFTSRWSAYRPMWLAGYGAASRRARQTGCGPTSSSRSMPQAIGSGSGTPLNTLTSRRT